MKQFNDVNTSRGAPMGRPNALALDNTPKSTQLFRVDIDAGGYDDGGAYWGNSNQPLWCARDSQGNEQFVRVISRIAAAAILEIPISSLQRGFSRSDLDWWFRSYCEKCMPPSLLKAADWEWWFEMNGYTIFDGSLKHVKPLKFKVTKSFQYTDSHTGRMVQGDVLYEVECSWRAMYDILNLKDPDWNKNQADDYFWTHPISLDEGIELRYFLEIETPTSRHKRYYRIARKLSMTC